MSALGTQLLVDLHDCDPAALDDLALVENAMVEAARAAGATVVAHRFHRFSPHGISGMVLISESHLAIHTWPEHRYAAVDLFTCGANIDAERGLALLADALGARTRSHRRVDRGQRPL